MHRRLLPAAITAFGAFAAHAAAPPSGLDIPIYGEVSNEFVQFIGSAETDIGILVGNFPSGGFVGNDITREFMIDGPNGDLYSVSTSNATATLIGSTGLSGGEISGPRWDPTSDQSFIEQCDAASSSTLYTINTSTGVTSLVGTSSGVCIVAIAFDPTGVLYGIDPTSGELVQISTSDGSTQEVSGFPGSFINIAGMEFQDESLFFVAEDAKLGTTSLYAYDSGGGAFAVTSLPNGFSAFDFVVPAGSAPALSKTFEPNRIAPSSVSLVTLTLTNPSSTIATLTAELDDALPSPMVIGGGAATTTCPNGNVSAIGGFAIFSLGLGAQIPAHGSCTVAVCVTADTAGTYVNMIPAGALQTDSGNNVNSANATVDVTVDVIFADGFDGSPGGCVATVLH